jgi:hypothetical protein
MITKKIHAGLLRILLLVMYGIFFTVQLTTYFDHRTGSTYRLNNQVFHTSKAIKQPTDGFLSGDSKGKKLTIRLNKKFHPQSALLYAMFVSKAPAFSFTKQPPGICDNPFIGATFLSDHSLRGPPAAA